MAGFNNTVIVGNIGRDPEMRYLPSGTPVCTFSVAVTRRFGTGDQRQEKTTWFRVSCWNKLAETANSIVRKGGQILVAGSVEASAYTDKSGQPQASLELRADTFQLLGSRGDNQGGGQGEYDSYSGGGSGGSNIDEIPF
jgi:single-strand DNA-binding protein